MDLVFTLFTITADENHIEEILASFTDEGKFETWVDDWLSRNRDRELYYMKLRLNPAPGEREAAFANRTLI